MTLNGNVHGDFLSVFWNKTWVNLHMLENTYHARALYSNCYFSYSTHLWNVYLHINLGVGELLSSVSQGSQFPFSVCAMSGNWIQLTLFNTGDGSGTYFLSALYSQEQFLLVYGWHEMYFWSLLVDMQMYPLYHKWKLIRSCWNTIVLSPRNTENSISHQFSAFPFANWVKSPTPPPSPQGFQRRFLYFIPVSSEKDSRCLFITNILFI